VMGGRDGAGGIGVGEGVGGIIQCIIILSINFTITHTH